jgi:hypothetical protein
MPYLNTGMNAMRQWMHYLRSDEAHMQHVDPETLLKQRGYDGAIYKNLHEDPGSVSYVPWYREQITILDVEPL